MISYVVALILYFMDPFLAIIAVIGLPTIEAMDGNNYTKLGAAAIFTMAIWFVKKTWRQ